MMAYSTGLSTLNIFEYFLSLRIQRRKKPNEIDNNYFSFIFSHQKCEGAPDAPALDTEQHWRVS